MAVAERAYLDRSPTPSTSLLPVGGAHRKLNGFNGQCVRSAGDDDVAETSFITSVHNGKAPAGSVGSTDRLYDHGPCIPTTSRISYDSQLAQGAAAANNCLNTLHIDTKGSDDNPKHIGVCQNCEAGPRSSPTSLFATGSRSTYAGVADNCSLPPEVERLRSHCVNSASSSSDSQHTDGKIVLWEFVACAAVLSLIVPFCGIPALIFAVRSQVLYRQGDLSASRAANLTALQLITVAGICVCVLAVTASVVIAVFTHSDRPPTLPSNQSSGSSSGSVARQRPQGMSLSSNAFEKALQRHDQEALQYQPKTTNNRPKLPGGFAAMIRYSGQKKQSFGRRSTTEKPRLGSGFMRRLRTRNG